ncbi:hypothetical protein [Rubellimicrobium roseum]|uniref:Uncharacterized protein n=1 Tax=Rubellimicrobium roseum TaxID=687525 RepID=A0A5C4NGE9_9RHOB|nr:hypothetical protein [Rubellimicrobium roseum]TNC73733.1 hypothetical protein FHG71_04440 [Rubellimicrobium roseum]
MIVRAVALVVAGGVALSACSRSSPLVSPAPQGAAQPQPVGAPVTAPPRDRLVAALESEGCLFSRETSGAVLLRANLTQAEAARILGELDAEGRLEAGGTEGAETIRLLSANCI